MKQFKITSENLNIKSTEDCILSPDDPIHELAKTAAIGGIGIESAMSSYNKSKLPLVETNTKAEMQRKYNIKPGTDAWFKLWFSKDSNNGI